MAGVINKTHRLVIINDRDGQLSVGHAHGSDTAEDMSGHFDRSVVLSPLCFTFVS